MSKILNDLKHGMLDIDARILLIMMLALLVYLIYKAFFA
jgi:hypothetical protein